jgi:hypothetical protein
MHQSGERHSHGARLLNSIQLEAPLAERFLVCYDVACVFGSALHLHHPDLPVVDKVELYIWEIPHIRPRVCVPHSFYCSSIRTLWFNGR